MEAPDVGQGEAAGGKCVPSWTIRPEHQQPETSSKEHLERLRALQISHPILLPLPMPGFGLPLRPRGALRSQLRGGGGGEKKNPTPTVPSKCSLINDGDLRRVIVAS